mmetsp:Transcript_16828/g.46473  ORF Transcript_16828/g.46473 Transcript_16828/m.46473 type:complete len:218 (-) Transcript_16828:105-758(-)|eukprot:CAMPEP_0198113680 /NCGR_PEP_ID=MMETSP1442-20131203/5293_1 /TAXON_ID= /ORGANISM="Craspedostauros australis, Strain CCMP3328" /LENGTH=217 /DNA_ID=CAMNT_0043770841 /DNA_START=86 /DNA_END=739 /DNA_ORIENTATION=+
MQRFITLLALLLVQTTEVSASSAAVQVTMQGCSGGSLSFDSLSMSCADSYCTWGSEATISGSYTLSSDLSSGDTPVKVTASMLGITVYDGQAQLCKGVESTTGSSCPSAGTYSFSTKETLPLSDDKWYSSISGGLLTAKIKANFQDLGSTCTFQVKIRKSGYSMTRTATITGAALAFVGAIVTIAMKRRRVATIDLAAEEGETMTHFEMMSKDGVQV